MNIYIHYLYMNIYLYNKTYIYIYNFWNKHHIPIALKMF